MALASCDCCGQARPLAAVLRRRVLRRGGRDLAPAGRHQSEHPLCFPCSEWLGGLIMQARRDGDPSSPLLGSPAINGRSLLFDDQCQVCRVLLGAGSSVVEWTGPGASRRPWLSFLVCPSCEGWIASLADDGRSARGGADRTLDGPYGEWLHPNLRQLSVVLDISDIRARATVVDTCLAMGVQIVQAGDEPPAAVHFVEVPGHARRLDTPAAGPPPVRILLAPVSAHDALAASLAAGAADWLTIPVTPQQITSALARALRSWTRRLPWDVETCLPLAVFDLHDRPALAVDPAPGVDLFELAWLLKRFSRGYDDVAVVEGRVVVVPRAARRDLDAVAARLHRMFPGRCTVTPLESLAARTRFEAAG